MKIILTKVRVPAIYPETEDEKWFYETAKDRVNLRHERRDESKRTLEFMSTKLYI